MAITQEEARIELARRELARRGIGKQKMEPDYESKGFGGILSDALSGATNYALGIPSALMQLPAEGYGAAKQVLTNPKRALQNLAGGFGDVGHEILSAPGNVRDYLQRKDIISENVPSLRFPESILPKQFNYEEALGRKGHQLGDELIRGLAASALTAPVAKGLFKAVEELPLSKTMAARPLTYAEKLIKDRNITSLKISNDILKDSQQFLPATSSYKKLLDKAKTGDYKSLFTLQSDLGKRSRELRKSSSGAERLHGRDAGKLRQKLLDSMKSNLEERGHNDIAELMTKGQNKYRQYHKIADVAKKIGMPFGAAALGYEGYKTAKNILD